MLVLLAVVRTHSKLSVPLNIDLWSVSRYVSFMKYDGAGTARRTAFTNYAQQMHPSAAPGNGKKMTHSHIGYTSMLDYLRDYLRMIRYACSIAPSLLKYSASYLMYSTLRLLSLAQSSPP